MTSPPEDETPADNDTTLNTLIDAAPDVAVTVDDGGVTATAGNPVAYTVSVTNVGDQGVGSFSLSQLVPVGTTLNAAGSPGWTCVPDDTAGSTCTFTGGPLAGGGGTIDVDFVVDVVSPVPAGLEDVDTAVTVTAPGDTNPANDTDIETTPLDASPDVAVTIDDGGVTATAGNPVAYTVSVTNVGDQGVGSFSLSQLVPVGTTLNAAGSPGWTCVPDDTAGSTCTFTGGPLAGGGGTTDVDFVVDVVSPVPAGLEDIDTAVTVTAPGDTNPANDTDIETTPLDAAPDVAVTIDDGGVTATPGNPIAYTVSVTNVGDQGVGSFSLSQLVPVGTTLNAAGSPGWTCVPDDTAGSTCTFTGGPLAGGGGTTDVDFVVDVVSPVPAGLEDIDTAVTVTAPGDTNPANDTDIETTPLDASPDVAVTIDDGGVTATAGNPVAYTVSVTNVGDQGVGSFSLSQLVPVGTTLNAAGSPGWTCVPDDTAGSTCTFTGGPLAGGGGTTDVDFVVDVVSPVPAGLEDIDTSVTVTAPGDTNPANDTDIETTPLDAAPDVAVSIDDGVGSTTPGSLLVYTVEVDNVGSQDASGVDVEVTVPVGTTFDVAGSDPGWVCTPGLGAGSVCSLPVGAVGVADPVVSVDFAVTVDAGGCVGCGHD